MRCWPPRCRSSPPLRSSVRPKSGPLTEADALPAYEVVTTVRSMGLNPISEPVRRGPYYVLQAYDARGREVRVVADARFGDILSIAPFRAPNAAYAQNYERGAKIIHVPQPGERNDRANVRASVNERDDPAVADDDRRRGRCRPAPRRRVSPPATQPRRDGLFERSETPPPATPQRCPPPPPPGPRRAVLSAPPPPAEARRRSGRPRGSIRKPTAAKSSTSRAILPLRRAPRRRRLATRHRPRCRRAAEPNSRYKKRPGNPGRFRYCSSGGIRPRLWSRPPAAWHCPRFGRCRSGSGAASWPREFRARDRRAAIRSRARALTWT